MNLPISEVKHPFFILKFYFRPHAKEKNKNTASQTLGRDVTERIKREFS